MKQTNVSVGVLPLSDDDDVSNASCISCMVHTTYPKGMDVIVPQ